MRDVWESLRALHSEGHRRLVDGLRVVSNAVSRDDYVEAAQLAAEIDREAGPHVEFEERYLYPAVEQKLGEAYATKLYDKHSESLSALVELQQDPGEEIPPREHKRRWLEVLRSGIEHADRTCSLLDDFQEKPAEEMEQLLHGYRRLRRRAHRWSQLHPTIRESDSDISTRQRD